MTHKLSPRKTAAVSGRWQMVLSVLFLLGLMTLGSTTQARLQPYEVVADAGLAEVKPRVLFVLDTSSSMMWKTQETVEQCVWQDCEDTGSGVEASRLATAREALQQVVTTVGDAGDFAMMTFGKAEPPTTAPANCSVGGDRFQWAEYYGFFTWETVSQFGTIPGVWRLCDDQNRGFPYLRYDDLGVGAPAFGASEAGAVPASPIISDDPTDYADSSNGDRKVQWFPSYQGTRVNPDAALAAQTVGDYNNATEVEGNDFYYWPYVDGFPGYSAFLAFPGDPFPSKLGVESDGADAVTLFAPFYLDLSSNPDITAGEEGPADSDAARDGVLAATAPLIEGGVDADGDTPWASAIGTLPADVDDNSLTLQDNSQYSHTSVSSYLTFVRQNSDDTACAPTSVVLITDGKPDAGEGGSTLNERLSALRETLGVKVYVVGFFISGTTEVNDMACAGNGVCSGACGSPCTETSSNGWDTCADPSDPTNNCAYTASSATDLGAVLTEIVADAMELDIGTGQGSRINDFGDLDGDAGVGEGEVVQTYLDAYTEWPSWRGHVERELCSDPEPYCTDPGFDAVEDAEEEFGPCPQGREWDAGTCLASTNYEDRRIYFNDSSNNIYRISQSDGTATAEFQAELASQGLLVSADPDAEADAITAFILGFNWPAGWKLPGLASSSPTLVRRVPVEQVDEPRVPIRDPHCAGRVFPPAATVPASLVDFSNETWDDDTYPNARISDGTFDEHFQYQEAVLVGDDLGVLHAFQYDSGNEIFGFLPRDLLPTAVEQASNGAATMGQPEALEDHVYGISATVNQGWVFDDRDADPDNHEWIHLAVFGLGIGGTELYALDVSHMSPISPEGAPFEILWTSEDSTIDADWDAVLGETWSRPSIAYTVPGDSASSEPSAQLILGSGYGTNGNNFVRADALTGEVLESNTIAVPGNRYGDYGTVGDMAVSSHCRSGMWAEVQEVYAADPAGQLFRWDVGQDLADSGADWGGTATPVFQFPACEGAGDTCTVGAAGDVGDIFTFGPAVSANDRIDAVGTGGISAGEDQFLVALVSGSTSDDDIAPHDPAGVFHSSLYLLVDDHSGGSPNAGFSIPATAPLSDPTDLGANPGYIRLAFTQIERTRTFTPYTGATQYTETRNFSKQTRPLRAPRIEVTGVLDGDDINQDVEVYRVTFTVYEPAADECDDRWYDDSTGTWYFDPGAVFEVTFRITSLDGGGFDFAQGSAAGAGGVSFSDLDEGATLESVEQVSTDEACTGGDCGARSRVAAQSPCIPGEDDGVTGPTGDAGFAVPVRTAVINGFSPLE